MSAPDANPDTTNREADPEEEVLRATLADLIDRTLACIGCAAKHHPGLVDELLLGEARLTFCARCDPNAGYPIGEYEWAEYEPAEGHGVREVAHGTEHCLGEVLGHIRRWCYDHAHELAA